jgi:hypothetical protein
MNRQLLPVRNRVELILLLDVFLSDCYSTVNRLHVRLYNATLAASVNRPMTGGCPCKLKDQQGLYSVKTCILFIDVCAVDFCRGVG